MIIVKLVNLMLLTQDLSVFVIWVLDTHVRLILMQIPFKDLRLPFIVEALVQTWELLEMWNTPILDADKLSERLLNGK